MGTAQNGRSADSVPALQIPAVERPKENRCSHCAGTFLARKHNQQYCTPRCQGAAQRSRYYGSSPFSELSSAIKGTLSELAVACDLLERGWQGFRAVAPACFADIAAYKNDASHFLEVRTGHRNHVSGKVMFPRGTNGKGVTGYGVYEPDEKRVIYLDLSGVPILNLMKIANGHAEASKGVGNRRLALLLEESRKALLGQEAML